MLLVSDQNSPPTRRPCPRGESGVREATAWWGSVVDKYPHGEPKAHQVRRKVPLGIEEQKPRVQEQLLTLQ